jgi:hypothetical protein
MAKRSPFGHPPKYKYKSAGEWLLNRVARAEAAHDVRYLAGILQGLVACGALDGDTIQRCLESDMDEDGFFTDLNEEVEP